MIKTLTQLLATFPDNVMGQVSAADVRELIANLNIMGGIKGYGHSAISLSTTMQKLESWDANVPSIGIVPNYMDSKLVIPIGGDGIYRLDLFLNWECSLGDIYRIALYKNGMEWTSAEVASASHKQTRLSFSVGGFDSFVAGDYLEVWIGMVSGSGTYTPIASNLSLERRI